MEKVEGRSVLALRSFVCAAVMGVVNTMGCANYDAFRDVAYKVHIDLDNEALVNKEILDLDQYEKLFTELERLNVEFRELVAQYEISTENIPLNGFERGSVGRLINRYNDFLSYTDLIEDKGQVLGYFKDVIDVLERISRLEAKRDIVVDEKEKLFIGLVINRHYIELKQLVLVLEVQLVDLNLKASHGRDLIMLMKKAIQNCIEKGEAI